MTAQKPPDKTLVGMPADLKAVLEKLDQATADKSAFSDPPRGSAFDPNPARQAPRPRTVPPPIPASERSATPSSVPMPTPAAPAVQDPVGAVPMDRTLIGMPPDMQAALARAIAEQADAPELPPPSVAPARPPAPAPRAPAPRTPPTAAGPALRAQPVRAIGVPDAQSSEAQVAVQAQRGPVPVPKPTAPASYQPVPPRAAPTYASGLGYQSGPTYQDPSRPVLAPQAPLDWPPSARRSEPGMAPVRLDETADADEQALLGTEATALAHSGELHLQEDANHGAEERSRLALPLSTFDGAKSKSKRAGRIDKRWIVLASSVLGVAALAGVGVWLAPKLLANHASESENAPPTAALDAPALPATVATDTSAATDPVRFTPTPTRPPAAPAMTSGASAQLEKKAIERLIANDFPAAKQLYEKLRSAEPTRPEFALMLELLNRASARPCGGPGQAPCAGAEP